MRSSLMKGHERPLTFLKCNRDGGLLFSCTKDHNPTVWFADNGALGLIAAIMVPFGAVMFPQIQCGSSQVVPIRPQNCGMYKLDSNFSPSISTHLPGLLISLSVISLQ